MSELLIQDLAAVRSYVPINPQAANTLVEPFIRRAQREFLEPALGSELLTELIEFVHGSGEDSGSGDDEKWNALQALAQEALANKAVLLAVPFLSVEIGAAGLQITQTTEYRSAYQWQVGDIEESLHLAALNALEAMYVLLEKNAAEFPSWRSSGASTVFDSALIRTATEFNAAFAIAENRITFLDLRAAMVRAQSLDLKVELGAEFIDRCLLHLRSPVIGAEGGKLTTAIALIRPALAHFTISRAKEVLFRMVNGALISTRLSRNSTNQQNVIDDRLHSELAVDIRGTAERTAREFLAVAHLWLDKNADSIPSYKDGPGYRSNASTLPDVEKHIHSSGGSVMV